MMTVLVVSGQLSTGDRLLPEPFLMTENFITYESHQPILPSF